MSVAHLRPVGCVEKATLRHERVVQLRSVSPSKLSVIVPGSGRSVNCGGGIVAGKPSAMAVDFSYRIDVMGGSF